MTEWRTDRLNPAEVASRLLAEREAEDVVRQLVTLVLNKGGEPELQEALRGGRPEEGFHYDVIFRGLDLLEEKVPTMPITHLDQFWTQVVRIGRMMKERKGR